MATTSTTTTKKAKTRVSPSTKKALNELRRGVLLASRPDWARLERIRIVDQAF